LLSTAVLDACEAVAWAKYKLSTRVTVPRHPGKIQGHDRGIKSCPVVVIPATRLRASKRDRMDTILLTCGSWKGLVIRYRVKFSCVVLYFRELHRAYT